MPVLFQFAEGDGPIVLYDIWKEPIRKTLALIESWCNYTIIGFNLAFDHFMVAKLYTIFRLCNPDWIPQEHIPEIAMKEPEGRDGPCVKPASALDLMLHSRKGPYQALMARDDVRIRKVPTALAYALAEELEKRVEIDGIFFARKADPEAPRWHVYDRERDGAIDPDFKDVVLRFAPAGGLKFLAEYAMGYAPKYHYEDVEPPRAWYPKELGYAPFAMAISEPPKWEVWGYDKKKQEPKLEGHTWPAQIQLFIDHWGTNKPAREYARDDIVYTRALDEHFKYPEPGDNDSILATMVPVIRWRGFRIDKGGMQDLRAKAKAIVDASPINTNKPSEVRQYLSEVMDDTEVLTIEETTKKAKLQAIRDWEVETDEECTKCFGEGCLRCNGGVLRAGRHPAALRAEEVLNIKIAAKEVELYNKLLLAGRFHASFVVVGTKSSRMSGDGGLNAQGIKATKDVRRCFPLAWPGYMLCGGDFDSFEVTLADAVYNDPHLRAGLVKKIPCPFCQDASCGECDENGMVRQKLHGLFGMSLYPGHTYAEVLASSGTQDDMYYQGKRGVFGMIYGGTWETLVRNIGVSEEIAKAAMENFNSAYPGVATARQKTFDAFCSMRQPGGVGTQVIWHEPADYIQSFLGFQRYFTLENRICRAMFELAQKPPKGWRNHPVKVWRRNRVQTAGGAAASALYGAAFGLQAANMRAAANHEIQSPGGEITKAVQRTIWDLQPVGVHELMVAPMNVHDELMTVTHSDYVPRVTEEVRTTVESFRPQVPLIGMTWFEEMDSWAGKKSGADPVKIRAPEMI